MAVTLKCPDCGYSTSSEDDKPKTCPQCEGTMKKPAYKAKSGSSAEETKPKSKAKDEDDEDEKPKKKAKPKDDDDEDEKPKKKKQSDDDDEEDAQPKKKKKSFDDAEKGGSTRDGAPAEALELNTGFKNKELMKQVEDELSRGEVLYWATRPSMVLAKRKAFWIRLGGIFFAAIGGIIMTVMLTVGVKAGMPWFAALIPGIFVLVGILIAILGPKGAIKQAERGWYAITDQRAVVYTVSFFGSGGRATSYEPSELRRMRVQTSSALPGGGDLIFRTEIHHTTRTERDARGRTRTSTSTHTINYGFLGIENVREVESLIHKVLLKTAGDDDDDEDDDD